MTLTTRRLYLAAIVVAFLVATPILLVYASGVRYDLTRSVWVRTGTISVSTKPSAVSVSMNGRALSRKTPLILRGVLPGSYTLALYRPGFHPWQIPVTITPGSATVVGPLTLFQDVQPEPQPVDGEILSISADGESALIKRTGGNGPNASLILSRSTSSRVIKSNAGDISSIKWSSDGLTVVYRENQNGSFVTYVALLVGTDPPFSLNEVLDSNIASAFPTNDGSILVLTETGQLFDVGPVNKTTHLRSSDVRAAGSSNGSVYAFRADGRLEVIGRSTMTIPDLPLLSPVFLESPENRLLVADRGTDETYFLSFSSEKTIVELRLPAVIHTASWQGNDGILIGDTEAWLVRDGRTATLLSRRSDHFIAGLWLARDAIVLANTNQLFAVDVSKEPQSISLLEHFPLRSLTLQGKTAILINGNGRKYTLKILP